MALTIYQDSIANYYVGYNGDLANIISGTELRDNFSDFPSGVPGISFSYNDRFSWRNDGTAISGSNYFFSIIIFDAGLNEDNTELNAKDASPSEILIKSTINGDTRISSFDFAVGYSNGVDFGIFAWSLDSNNNLDESVFQWCGEVKSNSNISSPQTRSSIVLGMSSPTTVNFSESFGVKQGDSSTKRIHLDTESGANHLIDCGTDTGRLFLKEDDGAGGDGGIVGYCENLYLSKNPDLVIGGFVEINGLNAFDGGSGECIVVGDWGDAGKILMRVYDGVS